MIKKLLHISLPSNIIKLQKKFERFITNGGISDRSQTDRSNLFRSFANFDDPSMLQKKPFHDRMKTKQFDSSFANAGDFDMLSQFSMFYERHSEVFRIIVVYSFNNDYVFEKFNRNGVKSQSSHFSNQS